MEVKSHKIPHIKTYPLGTTFVVDERYQFIKQIGYGAYGVVCSALDKKTGKKVAIKKVSSNYYDCCYNLLGK